ncbi:Rhamnogalacturonate lyase [Colletotrichum siamense]|nr:Rhamnogalacturonate lyase [Colletotrichum siamense]
MLTFLLLLGSSTIALAKPFPQQDSSRQWTFGNDVWNATQRSTRTDELWYGNQELVGEAVGHYYSSSVAANNFTITAAHILDEGEFDGTTYLDIYFETQAGEQHWVIFEGQHGAYQYFITSGMRDPGEFRSIWRLDNQTFTHGHTSARDQVLPTLDETLSGEFVFDSTYKLPNGTYITKYDFTDFIHNFDYYGVYGNGVGSWYIHGGKDYFNGDHLRQELAIHRELQTGDVAQLNMIQGGHFFSSRNITLIERKMYGPWLWYLNDGSSTDAAEKAAVEKASWPYSWVQDSAYHSRGSLNGKLTLSDGRPASNAAVFLGDNSDALSTLQQGSAYYYKVYADEDGLFEIENVRTGSYGLVAWANGSSIADVSTNYTQYNVTIENDAMTDLGTLIWGVPNVTTIFRIGEFDRTAYGFRFGGAPREYGLAELCSAYITYEVGQSDPSDWCYAQTQKGNWTIKFPVEGGVSANKAKLIISLAAYSQGGNFHVLINDVKVATVNSSTLANDGALYRSCTAAGEWRYIEYSLDASILRINGANDVRFWLYENTSDGSETLTNTLRGPMYDAIALQW